MLNKFDQEMIEKYEIKHRQLRRISSRLPVSIRGWSPILYVLCKNSKIYVALFPCNECAKAIIQSGISEVVYLSDKYSNTDSVKASKMMFKCAGVELRQLVPSYKEINLSLNIDDV